MTFLKMGFRNLFRQKRRTLVSLIVIMFGCGSLILAIGHTNYIYWGLREMTIHGQIGHIQIFNKDYFDLEEKNILEFGVSDFQKLEQELMEIPSVCLVLARIGFTGLITNSDKSVACMIDAVQPDKEKRLRMLFQPTESIYDSLLLYKDRDDVVLPGAGLAKSLGVKKGDYLTLMSVTSHGALNAIDLEVCGTFKGTVPGYDSRAIIVPLKCGQNLLNSNKVERVVVTLDETDKVDSAFNTITQLIENDKKPLIAKKWINLAGYYKKVKTFYTQMLGFMSVILIIIVFFSTSNTVIMSITERTTEIGTMLALGTSVPETLKTFFFEGLFMGIFGGILSIVFGLAFSFVINLFAIELPSPPGFSFGYPLSIKPEFGFYFIIFITTIIVTTLSALIPALKISKMKIIEALGHI